MWVKIGRSLANEAENTFDKIVEIISKTTVVLDLGGGEVI